MGNEVNERGIRLGIFIDQVKCKIFIICRSILEVECFRLKVSSELRMNLLFTFVWITAFT